MRKTLSYLKSYKKECILAPLFKLLEAGFELFVPPRRLCGDNGAMVGAQGYYEYLAGHTAHSDLNAYATMEL